jgi:hypothetical protein
VIALALLLAAQSDLSYGRDVRPILAEHCFACHGPDAAHRKSDLRLDLKERGFDPREIARRLTTDEKSDFMPPPKSGKKLGAKEKSVLLKWLAGGAPYERHWAFAAPVKPPLPAVRDAAWPRNDLDRFVLARLEREGLRPAPEAPRETLLRRAALDLTGLPGNPDAADYEGEVDRLLASPRYGERMALVWLDAARYADTHGLHVDSHRDQWPWRDWVIGAFNRNLPFDRFTVEQLAGDLLPGATPEQKTATGFNRNHLISYQGSEIPEKVHVGYVADRVNTTATVWLGLSFACAQCHDHKFDPIPQTDYYRLYAFFNTIAEKPIDGSKGNAAPVLPLASGSVMVMQEMEQPRATHLLKRGEYDQKGPPVEAGTPGCLPPMPSDAPRNRLGLARWLVDPKHPLTARVAVNRLWQLVFGTGLVASSDDFGAQGEPPSHPELLDWLATDFVEHGWDVKRTLRLLVTSATYRQSAAVTPEKLSRDPENRLLARGPRFRLAAELIRDQALAVSGLLVEKIGGPSVKPYQPAGVWEAVASQEAKKYTAQIYVQDAGDALWRRSLYTFWKRLAPPPALAALDAPSREACVVRRAVTNTPLQALVLLNDPTFVEAARALAARSMGEADPAAAMFRRATGRTASSPELAVLRALFERQRSTFTRDAAARLLAVGESPLDPSLDAVELAAWTLVASAILNLDEVLTR